jgi:hypothetical protein
VQRHLAAGQKGRQRRRAVGFFGRHRLDAGEADLATILQAKGTRIDDGGDAALTLWFEGASGRNRRTGCAATSIRLYGSVTATNPARFGPVLVTGFMRSSMSVQFRYAGGLQKGF